MPRMLRRAAVLGATAHVASQRGAAKAQQQAAQQETVVAPEQEAAVPEQAAPPVAEAAAPTADTYGDLMKLKELLDAGALTQAEFDAEKQKILAS